MPPEGVLYVRWPDSRLVRGTRFGRRQKSVYGLKQAPGVWCFTLKRWLLQYDTKLACSKFSDRACSLSLSTFMPTIFLCSRPVSNGRPLSSFTKTYPSMDEGTPTDILGMRMTFRDAGLVRECRMSQHGLIHHMLERYGMVGCNPVLSPMEPKLSLAPADPQEAARTGLLAVL